MCSSPIGPHFLLDRVWDDALTNRDRALEGDVDALKARVDAIEKPIGTR